MRLHLYLVRHGQTYFNRYNRLQGWSNSPLTKQGQEDALSAAQKLGGIVFSHAFCSDTTRAEQTARIILEQLEVIGLARGERGDDEHGVCSGFTVDQRFREQFYGYFEGQDMEMSWYAAGAPHGAPTYMKIVEKYGLAATKDFMKEADPFHDAESEEEYWARVEAGFGVIAHTAGVEDGDNILVISHGNTLLSLVSRFSDGRYDLSVRPRNGSVTRIEFDTDADDYETALHVVGYNE